MEHEGEVNLFENKLPCTVEGAIGAENNQSRGIDSSYVDIMHAGSMKTRNQLEMVMGVRRIMIVMKQVMYTFDAVRRRGLWVWMMILVM